MKSKHCDDASDKALIDKKKSLQNGFNPILEQLFLLPISSIEFLHNSKFSTKSLQNPVSIEGEEQNKKIVPTQDWTHNLQIISPMLSQLC